MSIQLLIPMNFLYYLLITTISSTCIEELKSSTKDCADTYQTNIQPYMRDECVPNDYKCTDFYLFLKALERDHDSKVWYSFWEDDSKTWYDEETEKLSLWKCDAIIPIQTELDNTCLCHLHEICNDECDSGIQHEFVKHAYVMIDEDPYRIPCNVKPPVSQDDCKNVWSVISTTYNNLCGDTEIYKLIQDCATNGPKPCPGDGTASPTTPTTPNPTTSPTTSTTTTTTPAPIPITTTASIPNTNENSAVNLIVSTDMPTPAPVANDNTSIPNDISTTSMDTTTSTYEPTVQGNDTITATPYDDDSEFVYNDDYTNPNATVDYMLDNPVPTNSSVDYMLDNPNTHPFANLLLVSLIILGFCVFVAWYAKKNQISSDGPMSNNDDNGYLWGLNKSSSPNNSDNIISDDGDRISKFSKGKFKHKKLSQFDDEMDKQLAVQMTINNKNNNDLLAITPDHISRLSTHVPPNVSAPNVPRKRDKKHKKSKKLKGKMFKELKDDDDIDMESSSSSSDSSGVDMMKMRDEYYASQTFSKKLADTLGDISETVKDAAQVVKTKLSKKEQTVVRPMQIRVKKGKGNDVRKKPFTMVEDNETTDGFDLSDRNDQEESSSTREDEYREDSETEVRVNIHGKKIKQPMKLPTFNDNDNDDDDGDGIHMLSQSHSQSHSHTHTKQKKKKKKDKKKKKKKKDKENNNPTHIEESIVSDDKNNSNKLEVSSDIHNINIQINNDNNMGFGSDELDNDHIELTNEDVTMTMNDLQMELMKHNQKENSENNQSNDENNNQNNKVDLSFMDNITNDSNNVDDIAELVNGNGVVGNGTND